MSKTTHPTGPALCIATLLLLLATGANATTLGQTRCVMLDSQVSSAMRNARPSPSRSVSAMAQKARSLCGKGKSSQGLRAYAKALKAMGLQPVLPEETQNQTHKG